MLHIHRLKLCRLVIVFDPGYCSIELAGAIQSSVVPAESDRMGDGRTLLLQLFTLDGCLVHGVLAPLGADCPCWQCNIWGSLHQISISQCMHTLLQTGNAGTLCRLCVGLKCDGRSSASIFQTKGTKCTPGMQDMFALCLLDKLEYSETRNATYTQALFMQTCNSF